MTINEKLSRLPDDQLKRLSKIAKEHTRLAAEFGRGETTYERKLFIWQRIEALKEERLSILEGGETI